MLTIRANWRGLFACGVALMALSVVILANADRVLALLSYAVGIALCGTGLAQLVAAIAGSAVARQHRYVMAAFNVLLGVAVLLLGHFALLTACVAIALNGAITTSLGLRQRKAGLGSWQVNLMLGIVTFAAGCILTLYNEEVEAMVGTLLGLGLLAAGLLLCLVGLMAKRKALPTPPPPPNP
ncbi:MAG: hypothetical protein LBS63_04920 [Prevotellaceae bacterium]|jgi:uncharacterized membrane protein HdeD (DUF308 family)|nr:hypothetical protein [Prevotellaceae bacterium]